MHAESWSVESPDEVRNAETKWWKLKEEECRNDFREKARELLQRREQEGRCDWETIAGHMKTLGEKVLG